MYKILRIYKGAPCAAVRLSHYYKEMIYDLSLYHFSVSQIRRSAGRSVIAAAAYRAGEKLTSKYDGLVHDYTHKHGVVTADILLPPNAPKKYSDRNTLWNSVEMFEKRIDAQLAYNFDVALQTEFTQEENTALVRQFLQENFVSRGMIVDYAIHDPDNKNGISNPHFHFLCPMRPLNKDGSWGPKRKRESVIADDGQRQTIWVKTTDWGEPETLEQWRQAWADLCNAKFEEKGLDIRIDNRSFARQGVDLIPTVHEGPAVREMEARGIKTNKGSLNRWIRATNNALLKLLSRVEELKQWLSSHLKDIRAEAPDTLVDLLGEYYNARRIQSLQRGYHKPSERDRREELDLLKYLSDNHLTDAQSLEEKLSTVSAETDRLRTQLHRLGQKIHDTDLAVTYAEMYLRTLPTAKEYSEIRFKKRREKFWSEHSDDLRSWQLARSKLKQLLGDNFHIRPDTPHELRIRKARLEGQQSGLSRDLMPLQNEVRTLQSIRRKTEQALQNRQAGRTPIIPKREPEQEVGR